MVIQLRSAELAKRIAQDFEKRYSLQGNRALTLDLIATQYGYTSWQALVGDVSPSAPNFVFDQDLSEDEFSERRVAQTRAIAREFRWHLPDALAFANALAATADQARPRRDLHATTPACDRLMLEAEGVYWVSQVHTEHPLAPPGFDVCTLVSVPALAKHRLENRFSVPEDSVDALIPWNQHGNSRPVHPHAYYTLDEVLVVEPVVWSFAVEGRTAPDVSRPDLYRTIYKTAAAAKIAVVEARDQYDQLLAAVKRLGLQCKRGEQAQYAARELLEKPWFWPLKPVIRNASDRARWRTAEGVPAQLMAEPSWRQDYNRAGTGLRDLDVHPHGTVAVSTTSLPRKPQAKPN